MLQKPLDHENGKTPTSRAKTGANLDFEVDAIEKFGICKSKTIFVTAGAKMPAAAARLFSRVCG
jgi:hypothetical protein